MVAVSTPTQPKHPAPGWAIIMGLAILAHPRKVRGSKTIIVDAQFYLGPTDQDLIIGSLRYFNSKDLIFGDGPNSYVINATFAWRNPRAEVPVSEGRILDDYTFIGDIQWIVPLGPPGPRYLLPNELPYDSASEGSASRIDPSNFPTFTIGQRVRPYVQLTGVAMECSKADATFEVTIEQFISCVKSGTSTEQPGGSRAKPATLFVCHIPDSPKYRNWGSKPFPGNKTYVSVYGFLNGVVDRPEQFLIGVENISFCGQYIPPVPAAPPNPHGSPVKRPGSRSTALFSYGSEMPPP